MMYSVIIWLLCFTTFLYPVSNKSYIYIVLSCPTWNTHAVLERLLWWDASHQGQIHPTTCKQWRKTALRLLLQRCRWGGSTVWCFRSADPDVILTGPEPGEVFGPDTLRSYYIPPTFLPLWLSWALNIALCQYRSPSVTMLMIKNAWTFNVKHDKGLEMSQYSFWTCVGNYCKDTLKKQVYYSI